MRFFCDARHVCPWFRLQVLRDHLQAVFRAEYDVDVVADARTGHCVVPSGLIYLNLMLPGTPVPGYRLFRPFGTRTLLGLSLVT
jgi:hypothetical protein